jgi:Resolvase, N terminal domain
VATGTRRHSPQPRRIEAAVGVITGVDLYLHQQGIDTTTPAGKAMFQMCGVFAEFERAMIRERVTARLAPQVSSADAPPIPS